jgi:opacity protein-like surface antigen
MGLKSLVVGVCLFAAAATAARAEGWYAGGFYTPYVEAEDVGFGTALGTVTTTFDGGSGLGFVGGREFGAWRLEGEWSMRDSDVEDHLLGGSALPGPTGELDATSYMVNAIYDFNREGTVAPYLGAGAGWTEVELDDFGVAPVPQVLSDDDSGFAYQLIAGLGFNFGERWNLFVDYRLLVADGLEVTVTPGAGGVTSEIDFETQSLQVGARFRF